MGGGGGLDLGGPSPETFLLSELILCLQSIRHPAFNVLVFAQRVLLLPVFTLCILHAALPPIPPPPFSFRWEAANLDVSRRDERRPHATEIVVGWANLKGEHRFGVPRGEREQCGVQLVLQLFWGVLCGSSEGCMQTAPCLHLAHSACPPGWLHLPLWSLGLR